MRPELFHLGPITIYSYGVMIALGLMAAYVTALLRLKRYNLKITPDDLSSLAVGLTLLGFLGARIFYVLQYWDELGGDWLKIFLITDRSGFVWYGGLLFGSAYLLSYCWRKKINFFSLGDLLFPAGSLGYAIGRWGCFFYGCCYGAVTQLPWGVTFPHHPGELRHPTQIYSSIGALIVFFILIKLEKHKKFEGQLFSVGLILHALFRFLEEFLRVNPTYLFNLSAAQWISLVAILGGVFLYARLSPKLKH
jgi:phosphatidylglycerol:prolipoprotein diacylglycerol transferase